MYSIKTELLNKAVEKGSFDCGKPNINEWVEDSYYALLTQQGKTFKIYVDDILVGYYMLTLNSVLLEDFNDDVGDYIAQSISKYIPCLELKYIAIDEKYQGNKYGSTILKQIIKIADELSRRYPIRALVLDSTPDNINWYEKNNFIKTVQTEDKFLCFMYIDLLHNQDAIDELLEASM